MKRPLFLLAIGLASGILLTAGRAHAVEADNGSPHGPTMPPDPWEGTED